MTSHYVHMNSHDRHDAADNVVLVPRSELTETAPPVTTPVCPSPRADRRHRAARHRRSPRRDAAHGAPGTTRAAVRRTETEGNPLTDPLGPYWRATCRAVEIARHLPRRLLVHLKSWRLVEVALNSCITTGLNTEVFRAAAGAALSWAHGLPSPSIPCLPPIAPTWPPH